MRVYVVKMWYSKFMFTGIVEEIGIVKSLEFKANGAKIVIGCQKVIEDVKIGDSIAIDSCLCSCTIDAYRIFGHGFYH